MNQTYVLGETLTWQIILIVKDIRSRTFRQRSLHAGMQISGPWKTENLPVWTDFELTGHLKTCKGIIFRYFQKSHLHLSYMSLCKHRTHCLCLSHVFKPSRESLTVTLTRLLIQLTLTFMGKWFHASDWLLGF